MRVLVACEESQIVTIHLRALGHEAYSCDLEPQSGGYPEWHLQRDVREVLTDGWDMMIAFPPCTHLASSGARWFAEKRRDGRQREAIEFFLTLAIAPIEKIAIENPVGIMSSEWRPPDQVIQPWQFGHGVTKKTCLWLQGLPKLKPTKIVEGREEAVINMAPSPDRPKLRSRTFPGVAAAMAEQWTGEAL